MTDKNRNRINEIESALIGKWLTENKTVTFFFMPPDNPGQKGKVVLGDFSLTIHDTCDYLVSIDGNDDPLITIYNSPLNQTKQYKIFLIDTGKNILTLLTENENKLNLNRQQD